MQKNTAWMLILVAFIIGVILGYTWHYQQTGRSVSKVCNTTLEGNEVCIHYTYNREAK